MRGILPAAILMLAAQPVWPGAQQSGAGAEPVVLRAAEFLAADAVVARTQPTQERQALRLQMIDGLRPTTVAYEGGGQVTIGTTLSESADTSLAETLLTVLRATLALIGVVIVALLTYTTFVRLRREAEERKKSRFRQRWEGPLYRRMLGDEISLPEVVPAERLLLLLLLIETIAIVRDDAADRVAAVARERGLEPFVMRLLSARSLWKREIGIRAAGALRLAAAVESLERMVARERGYTSLSAASALVTIDAERGFAALEPLLWRVDWSTERVAALIRSANYPTLGLLSSMLESAPPQRLKQIIRMIEFLGEREMLPVLRSRIAHADTPELTAAILHALRALGDASDRITVVAHLNHANWLVRMQAAYALGGLGGPDDADLLAPLLRDSNWWVRYRAAQSLLALVGPGWVLAAIAQEPDAYARDILRRVLAEQG